LDYVSKLTDEELRIICGLIPLKHFRDCFKSSPQKFHKIYSRCRPEKVTLEDVEILAVNQRNNPYLSNLLNDSIQILLDKTQDTISTFTNAGEDIHTALLRALPKSGFREHIDLYLKLSEPAYTPEYAQLLRIAVKEIEAAGNAADAEQIGIQQKSTTEETEVLRKKLAETVQELEAQRTREAKQDKANAELQIKFQTIQDDLRKKEQELSALQTLIDHADFPEAADEDEKYPFVSLCRVSRFNENNVELLRMADIVDGVIQIRRREDAPMRDTLYTQDRFKSVNFIGIWGWLMDYNPNSGRNDRVVSRFLTNQPAQIIMMPNCETVDELKESLLHGVDGYPECDRALFCFADHGKYTGLLCKTKYILAQNGKAVLRSNILDLPLYNFSEQEIVRFGRLRFFYRVNLAAPQAMVQITDPLDIVKQAIREGPATMKKLRPIFGGTNSQRFREFLEEIPTMEFYQEIKRRCDCSIDEAKRYVDDFIRRAGTYLREEDIETSVLETALEHSPSLLEKCRSLNEEKWRKEHTEEIHQAEAALTQISTKTQQQKKLYDQLFQQQKQLEERREQLTTEITQKEKLAAEVEKKVVRRIEAARKNAADFICEMAFTQPQSFIQSVSNTSAERGLFQTGAMLDAKQLEHYETWDDLVCVIRNELKEAGVSHQKEFGKRNCNSFAAFLYAVYRRHAPVLLAGPNGRDIADALSAALFGRTVAVLCCEGEYDPHAVKACLNDESPIVALLNPFHPNWVSHIHELTAMEGKFIVAVHPFAEDLSIEPRGLYNYMLPVLTELFVDQRATGNYTGGCFSETFRDYTPAESKKTLPLAKSLGMPPLVQSKLHQILADMKVLSSNARDDDDFLFGIVPYAYATGKIRVIQEKLQSGALSEGAKELLQSFLGELE